MAAVRVQVAAELVAAEGRLDVEVDTARRAAEEIQAALTLRRLGRAPAQPLTD